MPEVIRINIASVMEANLALLILLPRCLRAFEGLDRHRLFCSGLTGPRGLDKVDNSRGKLFSPVKLSRVGSAETP